MGGLFRWEDKIFVWKEKYKSCKQIKKDTALF